ncbi:MAG: hypothetical protein R2828_32710 [Saprospiraceae bacterium]
MKEVIEKNIWLISVIVAMIIGYAIGFLSIYYFKEYGWTVFTLVSFFFGLIPSLVYGTTKGISRAESIKIGFATLGIFCATTLLFAIEGIICIIMASPIMTISTLIGSLLGYWLVKNRNVNSKQLYSLFLLIRPVIN